MNPYRVLLRLGLCAHLVAAPACSTRESKMTTSATTKPLSDFTALRGGFSEAIAPGRRLVTLSRGAGATWWEGGEPVTATLPPGTPVEGARFSSEAVLQLGLGALDLTQRAWRPLPALAQWNPAGPRGERPVREVAWSADGRHLALLLDGRGSGGEVRREVVIVNAADGQARGRRIVDAATAALALESERVLVAGQAVLLLDLDGNVVAEPAAPPSVFRVRAGESMFAAIGATGQVALMRASDGAVLATWDTDANDAVPLPRGVAMVDAAGNVRIACLEGAHLRQVAEAATGLGNAIVQLVGDQLVVAGASATPVKVAKLAPPCP